MGGKVLEYEAKTLLRHVEQKGIIYIAFVRTLCYNITNSV